MDDVEGEGSLLRAMPTWDTIRNGATVGLSNVGREGAKQARLAKARLQLAGVGAQRQDALRALGQAMLDARQSQVPIEQAQAGWLPIWNRLDRLAGRETELTGLIEVERSGHKAPPSAAGDGICARCASAFVPQGKFCPGCGAAVPG